MKRIATFIAIIICLIPAIKADDSLTAGCAGSATPYPTPVSVAACPDSLTPVMINHVGRHGARYPSSASRALKLKEMLAEADSLGTITPVGRHLLSLVEEVLVECDGKWGMLDSLGMSEQEGIARRMYRTFPSLFKTGHVKAMASYVPRCVMSMDMFTHELALCDRHINIYTESGPVTSVLLRPFEIDSAYIAYREDKPYKGIYDRYVEATAPVTPAVAALGRAFAADSKELRDFAMTEYGFLSSLGAMSREVDITDFMTAGDYRRLWSCNNLNQYLTRTATTVSQLPAEIAAPLLLNLISTTDSVLAGKSDARVQLRFGHAETMMPLLSLMAIPGCRYLTDDFDSVASHWRNYYVVPMASNLQMILFSAPSGSIYVRIDLNEVPVRFMPSSEEVYVPWHEARAYLLSLI